MTCVRVCEEEWVESQLTRVSWLLLSAGCKQLTTWAARSLKYEAFILDKNVWVLWIEEKRRFLNVNSLERQSVCVRISAHFPASSQIKKRVCLKCSKCEFLVSGIKACSHSEQISWLFLVMWRRAQENNEECAYESQGGTSSVVVTFKSSSSRF